MKNSFLFIVAGFLLQYGFAQARTNPVATLHRVDQEGTPLSGPQVKAGVTNVAFRGVELGGWYSYNYYWEWTGFHDNTVAITFSSLPVGFSIQNNECVGALPGAGRCYFDIRFTPTAETGYAGSFTDTFTGVQFDGNPYTDSSSYNVSGRGTIRPAKKPVCERGSIIGVTDRTIGESVPIVGTEFSLNYTSAYAAEYTSRSYIFVKSNSFNREGWTISPQHLYDRAQRRLFMGTGSAIFARYMSYGSYDLVVSPSGAEVYLFDSSGKHIQTLMSLTGAVKYTFGYDVNNRLITITDAFSNQTTLTRNTNGRITQIQAPRGQVTTFVRNSPGLFAKITNPNGESYEMTYANSEASGLLQTFKKPAGQISTFTYDTSGQLIQDTGHGGDFWLLSALASGDGVKKSSNMNRQSTYQNSFSGSVFVYRDETAPNGLVTTYSEPTDYSSVSANVIEKITNDVVNDERFGNAYRRPSAFKYKAGGIESITTYGQSIVTASPSDLFSYSSITRTSSTSGRVTTSVFDAATKTTTTTSPSGVIAVSKINSKEQVIETQTGADTPITFSYDSYGRLSGSQQGSFNAVTMQYDSYGRLSTLTNQRSEQTGYVYDSAGRPTAIILPDARQIQYSYDANGNVSSVTPPGRPSHSFLRNAMDLLLSYLPPSISGVTPKDTTYAYNLDRQLTNVTRPDGKTINYTYNATTGVLTEKNASDIGLTKYYYYSGSKQLGSADTPYGVRNDFAYRGNELSSDELFRMSDSYSLAKVSYGYDADHRVISRSIRGNMSTTTSTMNITLNGDGKPTQVGGMSLVYSYPSGRLSTTSLDQTSDSRTYDSLGNLESYSSTYNPSSGAPVALYSYTLTRDSMSRIVGKSETVLGVTDVYAYSYDSSGRLTDIQKNSVSVTSAIYDSNSNRSSGVIDGVPFTSSFDGQDRMTSFNGRTYEYSKNGDLSAVQWSSTPTDRTTFSYDSYGNLGTITSPSSTTTGFGMDARGQRAYKKSGSTIVQRFVYEPNGSIAAEVNESGIIQKQYVSATGHSPDYMVVSGTTYRIVKDHLGSPRLIVNASTGVVTQRIDYGSFGSILVDSNPGFQPFGFAGGLYDSSSKLLRFGARDYDPEVGRWTSKDPIGFAGGDTNLYGYVANDPINGIDPSGLKTTLYNSGIHQVIGIDGPNGTMTYIDLVPGDSSNIGIISTSPASISVSSKYFGPPLTVAATYNTSALQEAELLNLASAYNLLAKMGIYQYQTFPFGGANVGNCRSFADDLLQGVGAK